MCPTAEDKKEGVLLRFAKAPLARNVFLVKIKPP